jgi:hypothetical protein
MTTLEARYRELLAQQLRMNATTWARLSSHGVTSETRLRLDFTYYAPSRESAAALETLLRQQTDYDVDAVHEDGGTPGLWVVHGRTQATKVSPAILDQWVDWMVTAGLTRGCEFDGWGTEISEQ